MHRLLLGASGHRISPEGTRAGVNAANRSDDRRLPHPDSHLILVVRTDATSVTEPHQSNSHVIVAHVCRVIKIGESARLSG